MRTAPSKKKLQRLTGTLVRIKDEGYGFIHPDNKNPDYYVAISSMLDRRDWEEGKRVEFTPGDPFPARAGERTKATPAYDVTALQVRSTRREAAHAEV